MGNEDRMGEKMERMEAKISNVCLYILKVRRSLRNAVLNRRGIVGTHWLKACMDDSSHG